MVIYLALNKWSLTYVAAFTLMWQLQSIITGATSKNVIYKWFSNIENYTLFAYTYM